MKIPPKIKEFISNAYKKADEAASVAKTEYINLTSKSKLEKLNDIRINASKDVIKAKTSLEISESLYSTHHTNNFQLAMLSNQHKLKLAEIKAQKAIEAFSQFDVKQSAAQAEFERLNHLN